MPNVFVKGGDIPQHTAQSLLALPCLKLKKNIIVTSDVNEINFGESYTLYAYIGSHKDFPAGSDTSNVIQTTSVNLLRDAAIQFMKKLDIERGPDDTNTEAWRRPLEESIRRSFGSKLNKLQESIYYEKSLLQCLKLTLVNVERRLQEKRQDLSEVKEDNLDKLVDKSVQHILRLRKTNKFEVVEFQTDYLYALTSPIYVHARNKWYFLGRYVIKIMYNGTIKMFSYDKVNPDRDHPHHPKADHNWCFGQNSSMISQLAARHDYFQLLVLLHRFLSHANTNDSWGRHIRQWPTLKKAEVQKLGLQDCRTTQAG